MARLGAVRAVLIMLPALLILACNSAPAPTDYGVQFAGAYDEVIGPDGPAAASFADAEYVQLRRPDDIRPIYAPDFTAPAQAALPDDELVIGLSINGDARAYPAGILYTRELVNDTVGGTPVLVSWCPRCYTALVHERRIDGTPAVFGNQGALYRGAMTWYDHASGSVWSQPLGAAIAGPRRGQTLRLLPSQLTTWQAWREAHPATLALTVSEPALPFRGRQPGAEHIVGIVTDDGAAAWPYAGITSGAPVSGMAGATPVALWRDADAGAVRAADLRRPDGTVANAADAPALAGVAGGLRELPVIIAYRWAWRQFYPESARYWENSQPPGK